MEVGNFTAFSQLLNWQCYDNECANLCPLFHDFVKLLTVTISQAHCHRQTFSPFPIVVLNQDLVTTSAESLGDLINGLSTDVVELNGVVAHGDRVALVELASNNGGESHASRWQTGDKKACD